MSDQPGKILKVVVRLHDLAHDWPDDLDALLVGPSGEHAMFLSDAGGGVRVSGLDLAFDSAATSRLPNSRRLVSGVYRPVNYGGGDRFAAPAPPPPYRVTLRRFVGTDPNGVWSLFIMDDRNRHGGRLSGGWTLELTSSTEFAGTSVARSDARPMSDEEDDEPETLPDEELVKAWVGGDPVVAIAGLDYASHEPVSLRLSGRGGESYRLLASVDLVHWEELGAGLVVSERFEILDDDSGKHPVRFYHLGCTPSADPVRLELLRRSPDGALNLRTIAAPGVTLTLEASDDLVTWTDLGPIPPGEEIELTDLEGRRPHRFYRLSRP